MDIFSGLNPAQKKAVAHTEGPLLIMAGAGSGKTKVLTCRIANLLAQGVAPYSILAITFTNKAATEMRERVDRMIGDAAKDVWLSTFHSFCARFLRREIEATGIYKRNFVIYDASDSQTVIKECLKEMNLDDKQFTPASVQNAISNAKNQLMGPKAMERDADNFHQKKIAEVYRLYANKLRNNNALDFDDLLMISVVLLEENEDIRTKYQGRFRYILVDEYQDTNGAQYQLTKILAARHHNLCVVGDADQSIYGWRGADIRNIMDFEQDYPEATVIKLEQNYRSTKNILAAANAVIEHNVNRKPKELWTENATGEKLTSYQAMDERDEAQFITTTIMKQRTIFNASYGDIAILYRTNAQSRIIEETFMRSGIHTRWSAASSSTTARRSRTSSRTCASSTTRSTRSASCASSMCRSAASARRRWPSSLPLPRNRSSLSSTSSPIQKSSTPSRASRRASRSHSSSSRLSSSTS